jgi:serine/threonine-protein kinase
MYACGERLYEPSTATLAQTLASVEAPLEVRVAAVKQVILIDERTEVPADSAIESGVRPRSVGPFAIGQVVGDGYEITKVLGVGGMNIVYEARDVRLGRAVAIKVPFFSAYEAALHREARALACLDDRSFVSVFDIGHEGEQEFLVMERLFGRTLEAELDALRMDHRRMPFREVLTVLVRVAEALSAAHGQRISHRDLKPANIIVEGERIVLFDLGLAVRETPETTEQEVSGSAHYMSPEVILGDVAAGEGARVDLYALGVIAFELLTNRTPFAGSSTKEVLSNHLFAAIPDPRTFRSDVPEKLATLVTRLLAKDPKARPPSARAVVTELRSMLTDCPRQRAPFARRRKVSASAVLRQMDCQRQYRLVRPERRLHGGRR